jgi:hypothetical protein
MPHLETPKWRMTAQKDAPYPPYACSPMALAIAMYHSGKNPLKRVRRDGEDVYIPQGLRQRRLHKAFLRYHDANNWPLLREALKNMGRADLIGNGKRHLATARHRPASGRRAGQGTAQTRRQNRVQTRVQLAARQPGGAGQAAVVARRIS